jgi:hypothetical protein
MGKLARSLLPMCETLPPGLSLSQHWSPGVSAEAGASGIVNGSALMTLPTRYRLQGTSQGYHRIGHLYDRRVSNRDRPTPAPTDAFAEAHLRHAPQNRPVERNSELAIRHGFRRTLRVR